VQLVGHLYIHTFAWKNEMKKKEKKKNIHNFIRSCKQGAVAACHVVQEYAVESAVG